MNLYNFHKKEKKRYEFYSDNGFENTFEFTLKKFYFVFSGELLKLFFIRKYFLILKTDKKY